MNKSVMTKLASGLNTAGSRDCIWCRGVGKIGEPPTPCRFCVGTGKAPFAQTAPRPAPVIAEPRCQHPLPLIELWKAHAAMRLVAESYGCELRDEDSARILKRVEKLPVPPTNYTPQPAPDVQAAVECVQMIQDMVDRFLSWKLPKDFNPDGGISFNPTDFQKANDHAWPIGTHLFTEAQAEGMVGFIAAKVIAGAIMAKNEWTSFKPYLKDGETPIMRLEREIADCQAVLSLLKAEKEKTQAAVAAALDEYKADIDAHKGALILSASKCKELEKELARVKDRQELDDKQIHYLIDCAVDDRNTDIKRLVEALDVLADGCFADRIAWRNEKSMTWLSELKAKYNL